ncbi:MAG TPA: DUF2891 family protein [Candidatus Eremiobacteraceae bacterium]|nr:DUF2891 family protein [Candidatus Eremiobacteraceae bacterium]
MSSQSLRAELAPLIAPVVLVNITRRFPYHDSRLFREGDAAFDPFTAHPAFGNSFDWHSSVHSHWTALQLIAYRSPDSPEIVTGLTEALASNLTATNIEAEAAYLTSQPSYERPYGWAWLLRLAAASVTIDAAKAPRAPLRTFAEQIADRASHWLSSMPGPVRHGVHSNTAFAMGLMLDASRVLGSTKLEQMVGKKAAAWFGLDRDYPAAWERSANDFLSPGLTVADLMRRVLTEEDFAKWWRAFVPSSDQLSAFVGAADVPNVSDGQIVHLHGLNLSRAAVLARLAAIGGDFEPLLDHARVLYSTSVDAAYGDDYLSTHWLPTFAWDAATSIDAAEDEGSTVRIA